VVAVDTDPTILRRMLDAIPTPHMSSLEVAPQTEKEHEWLERGQLNG
jgi:hypothetical protein